MGVAKVWDGTRWLRVLPKTWDGTSAWKDHPYYYPSSTAGQQVELFSSEQKNVNLQGGTQTSISKVRDGVATVSGWFTFKTDGTITRTTEGFSPNLSDSPVNNSTDWCTPRPFDLAKGDFYIRFSAGTGFTSLNGATLLHTENVWYDLHDNPSIICGITRTSIPSGTVCTKSMKVEIAEYIMSSGSGTMNILGSYSDYSISLSRDT